MSKKSFIILALVLLAIAIFSAISSQNSKEIPTHIPLDEKFDTLKVLDLRTGATTEFTESAKIEEVNKILGKYTISPSKTEPNEVPGDSIVFIFSYFSEGKAVKQFTLPFLSLTDKNGKANPYLVNEYEKLIGELQVLFAK